MADRETEDLCNSAKRYFTRLTEELRTSSWRPVLTEQGFKKAGYSVSSLNKNDYDFILNGFIDRIDYSADDEIKTVKLRIVDYKTGRLDNKNKENDLGKLIQYLIYAQALMDTGMTTDASGNEVKLLDYVKNEIAAQEGNAAVRNYDYEFESFIYDFPMEMQEAVTLRIAPDQLTGLNETRLRAILTIIETYDCYPDHAQLFKAVGGFPKIYPSVKGQLEDLNSAMSTKDNKLNQEEADNCKYCSYRYLCEFGKAGDK